MGFFPVLFNTAVTVCKAVTVIAASISTIATAVSAVTQALGLTKTNDPVVLGEKALQAEEANIRPENFKSYEEYVKEVEAFQLNPEKNSRWTKEEKETKALEVGATLLVEKFGKNAGSLIMDMAKLPEFFTPERTQHYLQYGQKTNLDLTKVSDLLDNKLKDVDAVAEAKNTMYELEKALNPELTPLENNEKIMELRAN